MKNRKNLFGIAVVVAAAIMFSVSGAADAQELSNAEQKTLSKYEKQMQSALLGVFPRANPQDYGDFLHYIVKKSNDEKQKLDKFLKQADFSALAQEYKSDRDRQLAEQKAERERQAAEQKAERERQAKEKLSKMSDEEIAGLEKQSARSLAQIGLTKETVDEEAARRELARRLAQGAAFEAAGNFAKAVSEYEAAVKAGPDSIPAQEGLARAKENIRKNAQAAMDKGRAAQKSGKNMEALVFFDEALETDSSFSEAREQMDNLFPQGSAETPQKDLQWREKWEAFLKECEAFYTAALKTQASYLVYSDNVKQGEVNYEKKTMVLFLGKVGLYADTAPFEKVRRVTQIVSAHLKATGRAATWNLNWPGESVTNIPRGITCDIVRVSAEIINGKGESIAKITVPLLSGRQNSLANAMPICAVSEGDGDSGVDINKVTDNMTVRITAINGAAAAKAAKEQSITILSESDYAKIQNNGDAVIFRSVGRRSNAEIFANGQQGIAIIDNGVTAINEGAFNGMRLNDEPFGLVYVSIPSSVTSIGRGAFESNGLRNVTLPPNLTSIGDYAFNHNPITSITLPPKVSSIGNFAFQDTLLTSIVLPPSVKTVGQGAFLSSPLRSITLGANVQFSFVQYMDTFGSFVDFYNNNGKKAGGPYTW